MAEPLIVMNDVGEMRSTQTRFIWSIKNFEDVISTCRKISSCEFTTITDGIRTKWKLQLYLKDDREDKDDIGIYIECLNRRNILATIEFYLLDVHDKMAFNYTLPREQFVNHIVGTPTFMEHSDLVSRQMEFYSKDTPLRIVCVIITNESIKIEEDKEEVRRKDWQRLNEFNKFADLWLDTEFSDIILNVKGEQIPAHRNILACSSAVFKIMVVDTVIGSFASDQIIIEDVDAETMRYMLEFIYTGQIRTMTEQSCFVTYLKLLDAADKYCLASLKSRCEERLSEKLTVENVFEALRLAGLDNATSLRQECVEFVISNAETIANTTAFEAFVESEPKLSCELFRSLITKTKKVE